MAQNDDDQWLKESVRLFEHYALVMSEISDGIHLNFDRSVVDARRMQGREIFEKYIEHMKLRAPDSRVQY